MNDELRLFPIETKPTELDPIWEQDSLLPSISSINNFLASKSKTLEGLEPDKRLMFSRKLQVVCTRCPVRSECLRPVPSSGPQTPKVMVVGRNPGRQEDKLGIPFAPSAPGGRMLDRYLASAGLVRQDAYITNALMCYTSRPRPDRPPTETEIRYCAIHKYLEFQSIQVPRLIITLGYDAHQIFFNYNAPSVSRIHGTIYETQIKGQPTILVPTLHPGHTLRDPLLLGDVGRVLNYVRKNIVEPLGLGHIPSEHEEAFKPLPTE